MAKISYMIVTCNLDTGELGVDADTTSNVLPTSSCIYDEYTKEWITSAEYSENLELYNSDGEFIDKLNELVRNYNKELKNVT